MRPPSGIELSIQSDLGMQFLIASVIFIIRENENCISMICGPLFFLFVKTVPEDPHPVRPSTLKFWYASDKIVSCCVNLCLDYLSAWSVHGCNWIQIPVSTNCAITTNPSLTKHKF